MFRTVILACIAALLPFALQATETVPTSQGEITMSFAPVVKRVVPAVVNIITQRVERVESLSPFLNDPFFGQFFAGGMGGLTRERMVHSLGSGVIVGADGTIVTSYHVVKGSDKIVIVLSDKREFEGHVAKVDERSDLAVLKVDTKGAKLPVLALRDSDTLEVGDLVLAVGDPFGVGQTVTSGIISALARSAAGVSDYQFFIQTDAAINPGNSGGALVDMQGRLIGINTAIYSQSGGYQGIGFAIPANMVKAVLGAKADGGGAVIRPWFGVAVQPVTQEIAEAQGLGVPRGVLVQQVVPHSPAYAAGIRAGDILIAIGSGEVDDAQGLNFRIATTGIGIPTTATIWREGKELTLPVTFVAPPSSEAQYGGVTITGENPLKGAIVAPLSADIAEQLHIEPGREAVVVIKGNGNNGWGMNVRTGDIIIAVSGRQIRTVEELQRALHAPAQVYQIILLRGGLVLTLTVQR